MSRKINVLLADNSEYFAVPCANVMKSHGLEVTLTEKDGKAVKDSTKQFQGGAIRPTALWVEKPTTFTIPGE